MATTKADESPAARELTLISRNPRTGKELGRVPAHARGDVAGIVAGSRKMAPEWAAITPRGRAEILSEVRHRLHDRMDDVIATISEETGKPLSEAMVVDVLPACLTLLYYERFAHRMLRGRNAGRFLNAFVGLRTRVEYRPYGVVGCITPWNYPLFLPIMAMAPALFAGNTVVLKPSEFTPRTGERIRELLEPLPAGVATVVQGTSDVGAALVDAPCDKLCFIGSPATGRKIAEAAARHLTPVVMELGGKDPAVVCADADLETASSGVLWGSLLNTGQTCASIERVYVTESIADDFTDKLVSKLRRIRYGNGDADMGSLTTQGQVETVRHQVADAVAKGARVVYQQTDDSAAEGSCWHGPVVLDGITDDMDMMWDETFGPVIPIVRVRDEEEALRRVNEEGFSLTASVWTSNRNHGLRLAERMRAGAVTINAHAEIAAAPWIPWGGVGASGYGRLQGEWGLREFTNPVPVASNSTPQFPRLWWYPYEEHTVAALRSLIELLSAPGIGAKAKALPVFARNLVPALKRKL